MNDFWEWMGDKGYGTKDAPIGVFSVEQTWLNVTDSSMSIRPTKQMLIGYMMEYLREKEGMIILSVGGRASIKDVYDYYVRDIEKVEKDGHK